MRLSLVEYAVAVCLTAAGGIATAQPLSFANTTNDSGVVCTYQGPGGVGAPNQAGGGGAGDFNRDGFQDLFLLAGGETTDHLYINNGDGTFTRQSTEAGITVAHAGGGIAVGDVDNNGYPDVFVASFGPAGALAPGQHLLYLNNGPDQNGQITFTQVAAIAGVSTTSPVIPDAYGAALGDYDLDGDLDLVVSGWATDSFGNRLFRNDGVAPDGIPRFTDVTASAIDIDLRLTHGFSPRFADTNNDLYPEILWAADFVTSKYLVNNADGTFSNQTASAGTGLDRNGMGNAAGDINNDGLLDWYVTSIEAGSTGNTLYLNQGDHTFTEIAGPAGVRQGAWGWGSVIVDLDLDTHPDIVATNGWPGWASYTRVFLNDADLTFTESSASVGIVHETQGRGVISLDLENDGDQDLVLLSNASPAVVYRNNVIPAGGAAPAWLRVSLDTQADPRSAPDGLGARVEAVIGATTLTRWLSPGSNYLSQSETTAHFGLAGATVIDTLRVQWTTGLVTHLHDVPVNQNLTIHACPADFFGDGVLDITDVLAFVVAFAEGDRRADMLPDGVFDFLDVFEFLVAFSAGCE